MAEKYHYVPMLKTKPAEMQALRDLRSSHDITPLIEITVNPVGGKRTLINGSSLPKYWKGQHPFFLDLEEAQWASPSTLDQFASDLLALKKPIIPVTSLGRPAAYQQSVSTILQAHGKGLCLRLPFAELNQNPQALLASMKCKISDCDLIIDMGEISSHSIPVFTSALLASLQSTGNQVKQWRSFTIASGAFPFSLSHVSGGTCTDETRADWIFWQNLVFGHELPRTPWYGDYGINHPKLPEPIENAYGSSPNIRYALDDRWHIKKAYSTRTPGKGGYLQYHGLCKDLIAEPFYCGSTFSGGDDYIAGCASHKDGPGNAVNWRYAGFSHHFEFVLNQLASLP